MTNFEKWQYYMKDIPSPQNFVDWGFYHLIGICLQRRVWLSATGQPCFPNKYTILTGRAGIGKGLVINPIRDFASHWKLEDAQKNGHTTEMKTQAEILAAADLKTAQEQEFQGKGKQAQDLVKPLLFPQAPNCTTFQALIEGLGDSFRRINYLQTNPDGSTKLGIYGHSSISFISPELSELLRKNTEDTVNILLGLYDCPIDFEYRTISRGKDRVRRGCVNLIAGTTPSFMSSTFDSKLADEGFTSRTFFIFAKKNRFSRFFIPDRTKEQMQARTEILEHLRNLSTLYGRVEVDPQTFLFLEDWWQRFESDRSMRTNRAPQLETFFSRFQIHVMKLAMALHFGESVLMKIPLSCFERSIAILLEEAKNMHLAIRLSGDNKSSKIASKIMDQLEIHKTMDWVEIFVCCNTLGDKKMIEDAITFLQETGQINVKTKKDETLDKEIVYYEIV